MRKKLSVADSFFMPGNFFEGKTAREKHFFVSHLYAE